MSGGGAQQAERVTGPMIGTFHPGPAPGPEPAVPRPGGPPTAQASNLPPRNPAFTGRATLLTDLGTRLAAGPVAVPTGKRPGSRWG